LAETTTIKTQIFQISIFLEKLLNELKETFQPFKATALQEWLHIRLARHASWRNGWTPRPKITSVTFFHETIGLGRREQGILKGEASQYNLPPV
jgi:hypothetical protein